MNVKGKETQQNRVEPSEYRDLGHEVLQALINYKIKTRQPVAEELQKGGQTGGAAATMSKLPSKRAVQLNINLDDRTALRSSVQTVQNSSNALSSLVLSNDIKKIDGNNRSGTDSTRHDMYKMAASQVPLAFHDKLIKDVEGQVDQVFGRLNNSSSHFTDVVNDLVTNIQKKNKLKPIQRGRQ